MAGTRFPRTPRSSVITARHHFGYRHSMRSPFAPVADRCPQIASCCERGPKVDVLALLGFL